MAATCKYYIIGVILIFSCSVLHAGNDQTVNGDKIMSIARQEFLDAKKVAENVMSKCENESKTRVIQPSVLNSVNVSSEKLRISLFYFNRKARDKCEGSHVAQFFASASRYRTTAKHYGHEAAEAIPYSEEKLYGSAWRDLRIKMEYYALEKQARNSLEQISELKKPFNLHKTLTKLGTH